MLNIMTDQKYYSQTMHTIMVICIAGATKTQKNDAHEVVTIIKWQKVEVITKVQMFCY